MELIKEDFFDDEQIQSSTYNDEVESDSYSHTLKYFCCFSPVMEDFDEFFEIFIKMLHRYLNYSSFMVTYDAKLVYLDEEYELTQDNIWNITSSLDLDEDCIIQIRFNSSKDCNFSRFSREMSQLSNIMEELCCNYYVEISLDDKPIMSEYDQEDKYCYHVAYHKMFSMLFGHYPPKAKMSLHYNGGVKLSPNSEKKINEFVLGDKLYATSTGELVSQEETNGKKNTHIGVCVIPTTLSNDNSARFSCVNRYPSLYTPDNGSRYPQKMYFGTMSDNNSGCGDYGERFKLGGEEGTRRLYQYMNHYGCDHNWKSGRLSDSKESGYCPPISAIWRFRTVGTNRGDWYLPSCSELLSLGRNKAAMKKGFNLGEINPMVGTLWTSVEESYTHQKSVVLSKPIVNPKTSKGSKQLVFAFLKVTD